jgi:hypothetical protein
LFCYKKSVENVFEDCLILYGDRVSYTRAQT